MRSCCASTKSWHFCYDALTRRERQDFETPPLLLRSSARTRRKASAISTCCRAAITKARGMAPRSKSLDASAKSYRFRGLPANAASPLTQALLAGPVEETSQQPRLG